MPEPLKIQLEVVWTSETAGEIHGTVSREGPPPEPPSAPVVSQIAVSAITDTTATITAATDTAAQARVEMGQTVTDWTLSGVQHSMALTGLTPGTTITYVVRAKGAGGETTSPAATFETTGGDVEPAPTPGGWRAVSTNTIRSVLPPNLPADIWGAGSATAITEAWNSGAWDDQRKRMYVWGAGHYDGAYNGVMAFDLATGLWSRLTEPSLVYPKGNNQPSVDKYSDGTPAATHTYGTVHMVNADELMVTYSGSRWWDATRSSACAILNVQTKVWRYLPITTRPQLGRAGVIDGNRFVWRDEAFSYRHTDLATGAVTKPQRDDSYGSYDGFTSALDLDRKRMISIGKGAGNDGGGMLLYDINGTAGGWYRSPSQFTGPAAEIMKAYSPGIDWDARRKIFVAWKGGADVYEIDANAQTVVKVTGTGTAPKQQSPNGTWNRWRYMPSTGEFIVVNSVDEPVYVYTPPGTTPEPPPISGGSWEWRVFPQRNVPSYYSSSVNTGGKHGRIAFNTANQRLYCVGGDWYSKGDSYGNGNNEVWSYSISGNNWIKEYPPGDTQCAPPDHTVPPQPDESTWVYDTKRNVFHLFPGFWFGETTYRRQCPNGGKTHWGHLTFDPVAKRYAPGNFQIPPAGWGGDTRSKNGVYDPGSDQVIRVDLGPKVQRWQVETGKLVEESLPIAGAYCEQDQIALDPEGRCIYGIDYAQKRLVRYHLDNKQGKAWKIPDAYAWHTERQPPDDDAFDGNKGNVGWDRVRKCVVLLNTQTHWGLILHMFTFDPATEEFTEVPLEPPGVQINGNTLGHDTANNVFILMGARVNPNFFLLRAKAS